MANDRLNKNILGLRSSAAYSDSEAPIQITDDT